VKYFMLLMFSGIFLLAGCEHFRNEPEASKGHIKANQEDDGIPPIATPAPILPEPAAITPKEELHTLVVSDVSVRELLFSLARDTNLNLDIDDNVDGVVTINAINQPLPAILDRIANSSNLDYKIVNNVLTIRKDTPYLYNYKVDYLNMSRISDGGVSVSTQISSTGQGASAEGTSGSSGNNNSLTQVKNLSENNFWATLQKNISNIIGDGSTTAQTDDPNIIMNRESGIMGVRATKKQHKEIQHFLSDVQQSSQRQVLIEATIAEVKLSDRYQAGINWTLVRDATSSHSVIFDVANTMNDISLNTPPVLKINASKNIGGDQQLQTTLQALQTFGDVKIMSSPKIMALNNQTALLKVVDNLVYFTVDVNIDTSAVAGGVGVIGTATYETKINTVPVGFVMSVTPYINEQDSVTLNVRPTISRVIRQMRDPNPDLAKQNVINEIPVIQVREVESVLRINSGDIAIIGGLMQDEISNTKKGIPVLSKLPLMGSLFRYDDDNTDKTELVIFIKPIVVKHASLSGDLKEYRQYLPGKDSADNKKE
jgi:MSHA type pilus biogenesis protein MshL